MYLLHTEQIDHTNNKLLYPWKYSNDNSEILHNISELKISYTQYGFPIKYKNKKYLITTAHNTNDNTTFYYNELLIPIININYDLDIIILENIIDLNYYEYNLELNFCKNESFNNNKYNMNLNFNKIYESNISFYTCNCLMIECNNIYTKILKGHSGIPIFNSSNYIIGIISRINNDTNNIDLIPMINVVRLLRNNQLCYISEYLSIKNNEIYINKKSNKCAYKKKKYLSGTFKKNDIIYEIDKKKIINGYIYDNILNINVSVYIYILYNKNDKEKTIFSIIRNNQLLKINKYFQCFEDFKTIKKTLITINYYDELNKILYYEYNENILINYIENKIYIPKKIPLNFLDSINCCTKLIQEEKLK